MLSARLDVTQSCGKQLLSEGPALEKVKGPAQAELGQGTLESQ